MLLIGCSKGDLNQEECFSSTMVNPKFISQVRTSSHSLISLQETGFALVNKTVDSEAEVRIFDKNWNLINSRIFNGRSAGGAVAIRQFSDESLVILHGDVRDQRTQEDKLVLTYTTKEGEVINQFEYLNAPIKNPSLVEVNDQDEVCILGGTGSFSMRDLSFMKISKEGVVVNQKTIEQSGSETPSEFILLNDGGYIALSNNSEGEFLSNDSLVILRLDNQFNAVWRQVLEVGLFSQFGNGLKEYNNDYYLITSNDGLPAVDEFNLYRLDFNGAIVENYSIVVFRIYQYNWMK